MLFALYHVLSVLFVNDFRCLKIDFIFIAKGDIRLCFQRTDNSLVPQHQ